MAFRLSALSRRRLKGVHADLVRVMERAIELTPVDFRIQEGVRTQGRQQELIRAGASRTLNSRHLTGHAVDVVAMVGPSIRWDWPLYPRIAAAVGQAAKELRIPVVWGGCWRPINDIKDLDEAVALYVARKRAAGKKPLMDGPHFELYRVAYPT